MLNITKRITLSGQTIIDGASVAGYSANIDSENPSDMTLSMWQNNKELYKENRTTCRQEQAEFEDTAYALQDEMIASLKEEANE
jgi:hypothetical protein